MLDKRIVKTIVKDCLGCKQKEELLIVCDDKLSSLGHDFYHMANLLGVRSILTQIPPGKMHGEEPPQSLAWALAKADAALLLTSMSLSHTKARKNACKKYKTRIASLPGATEDMLKRTICFNYKPMQKQIIKIASLLSQAKTIEIRTKKGTHLTMSVKEKKGFSDDGFYTKPGSFGNLPAGEACRGPLEGTTKGRLIIDGSAPFVGKINRPIEIIIKNGYAQNIPIAQMRPLVNSFGKPVLSVAELGIGFNPKARITGCVLEDEKAKGTAHIALGNNKSFGGRISCPCHLDFVFLKPTILLDGIELKL